MDEKVISDVESFMSGLTDRRATPTILTVHRFMGDARKPFPRPQDHVLCWSILDETYFSSKIVDVTLVNADVTCKDCLELIHA